MLVLYYDTVSSRFVYSTTGAELLLKDYPVISYEDLLVIEWHIGQWNSTTGVFDHADLSGLGIAGWQSSIDTDLNSTTSPMVRSLTADIDDSRVDDGIITVTYDTVTTEFLEAVEDSETGVTVHIDLKGYNSTPAKVFYACPILKQLKARAEVDPSGDPPAEVQTNFYTKAENDAHDVPKLFSSSATLTDNTANTITLGSISSYQAISIKGYIRNAAGSVNYFSGAVYHNGTTAENNIKLTDFGGAFITGVTYPFTADISGDNLRLIITLSGAGQNLTMKYGIENYIGV